MLSLSAAQIKELLALQPHPEGGYFAPTYRSAAVILPAALPARYLAPRPLSTAIYYLLTTGSCSRLHRLKSDEIFHFYGGDPVEMLFLSSDGTGKTLYLGNDLLADMYPQLLVPHGVWQGARLYKPEIGFALLGCTVAPGFDYADFELGVRAPLLAHYPQFAAQIRALTE
ncbi:MAG TPA: cupin domain-containing protein [Thermoflexia bacterium]|nr:cupin domain-containing protein [Thermoflexia bacterium]